MLEYTGLFEKGPTVIDESSIRRIEGINLYIPSLEDVMEVTRLHLMGGELLYAWESVDDIVAGLEKDHDRASL